MRLARAAGLTVFVALGSTLPSAPVGAEEVPAAKGVTTGIPANGLSPNGAPATGLDPGLEAQVRALALGSAPTLGVTRVEVVVGQIDPRLHLAPCQQVEPYLANGAPLWGRTRMGLRCAKGLSAWNVYLPITVKAFGRGLVATSGATAGSVLGAGDVAQAEVDLAEGSTAALVEPSQAIGRTLAVALKPGQSLRQSHFKPRLWFAAGETVRIVAAGAGFSLESEGQALSNGVEGQVARVRVDSGRVLTGQPSGQRRIELTL
ncbi:MAG: flagellar basal body P-ring formation chaperone FlgA [Rhizobacter sp.]